MKTLWTANKQHYIPVPGNDNVVPQNITPVFSWEPFPTPISDKNTWLATSEGRTDCAWLTISLAWGSLFVVANQKEFEVVLSASPLPGLHLPAAGARHHFAVFGKPGAVGRDWEGRGYSKTRKEFQQCSNIFSLPFQYSTFIKSNETFKI